MNARDGRVHPTGATHDGDPGMHRLRRIAWILDDLVRVPGTSRRFGLDPVLGLLPGAGDIAGGALSAYVVIAASRLGAPSSVILRMGWNIVVDTVLGAQRVADSLRTNRGP